MNEREQLQTALEQMPEMISGKLCLDFANTVEPRGGLSTPPPQANQQDYLKNYAGFLAWSMLAQILTEEEAVSLLVKASPHPQQQNQIMQKILATRELIYGVFWKIAHNSTPDEQELTKVQNMYLEALTHAHIEKGTDHFIWQWSHEKENLFFPLWPIMRSTVQLLTEGEQQRLKTCPGVPGDRLACAWLFYDESKNKKRQWCSMQDCGSATKAMRLTQRRRAQRTQK